MGLIDTNRWGCLLFDETGFSTRGLSRKKNISYLSAKLLKPYQSLYIILICQSKFCY